MDKPIPEAVLDRLAHEAYQVHCDTPTRAFPNDTHWPKWRAVVQHVADALTAAQQQGQARDCHCATCTCHPGMTPAVRFDTTPADKEGAVRDHLIALGWTPPGAQQPAADEEAAEQYRKGWEAGHAAAQQPAAVDEVMRAVAEALPPRPIGANTFGYQMSPLALTTLHDRFAALAAALAAQHQEHPDG